MPQVPQVCGTCEVIRLGKIHGNRKKTTYNGSHCIILYNTESIDPKKHFETNLIFILYHFVNFSRGDFIKKKFSSPLMHPLYYKHAQINLFEFVTIFSFYEFKTEYFPK